MDPRSNLYSAPPYRTGVARRKRKEDVPVWEPPEFDEVGYMRKEIENAKISVVVIAWAVVGAILLYVFSQTGLAIVGFLLGLLVFGALYFVLPMLGLPIHGFKRRDWASHAMVYFFSWLAFSILLLNAPFSDHTYPVVGSFQAGTFTPSGSATLPPAGSVACYAPGSDGAIHLPASSNSTVLVLFRATDNVGISRVNATVPGVPAATLVAVGGVADYCSSAAGANFPPDTFAVRVPLQASQWTVQVTAVDTSGLRTAGSVQVLAA